MRRIIFATLLALGIALLALTGCSNSGNPPPVIHIQQNNNAPSSSASASAAPQNPAPPDPSGFLVLSVLEQSMANEQSQFLADAPASDYDSADDAPISVSCQSTGADSFTCTGSDTDGDAGSPDNVTVAADGSSWSDSGMTWTGPDVSVPGGFTVGPVTGWSNS
ncbi:MAG TPA: hypothetical protein VMR00_17405 [Streptosporangiaceae bacterium]|jgi:hypothetical protein|nr:hypothetical protein [Streptosporangiaceae bacterium]